MKKVTEEKKSEERKQQKVDPYIAYLQSRVIKPKKKITEQDKKDYVAKIFQLVAMQESASKKHKISKKKQEMMKAFKDKFVKS